uniref:Reverse transcriptase domain-containing protein n=1 Tax=Tanacetum cinerariifolium TaxID=118510 RepID=A0A6L2MQC1_TANCI|nr:hypothetical protein [Tanacetum cinerariifolium]
MGDEHLNTIPVTESDEFIKSSVENLVPNPSESKGENGCDVHACFTTFSNILFNADYEFNFSDDQSLYDEDVPEKIFSNPLFEEEIIPMKIDQHHDNAESDLVESLRTHDSSLIISSKIDSLLYEFAGELILLKSILPGIDETDCDPEEDIHLIETLLYDNSSPRPPEEFVFKNSDAKIETFSSSPIPPSIEEDDDDSEKDILILEEFLDNYSLSLPEKESFHFDIPSFSRPPAKPPYGGTTVVEVILVKGHLVPSIVKVRPVGIYLCATIVEALPVGFDPLALVELFTHVEVNKRFDEVLSWLVVGGYLEANVLLMNAISLLRLTIGSSEGRKDGTISPESSYGNDADGASGGVRDKEVVVGEGVMVTSSSREMLTNSRGGIMVSLIFLEGLEEEALVEFMVEWVEEDEDSKKNRKDDLFN